jgi:hypothetical protein
VWRISFCEEGLNVLLVVLTLPHPKFPWAAVPM